MAVGFNCSGLYCSGALEVAGVGQCGALVSWQLWAVTSDFCRSSEFVALATTLVAMSTTTDTAALATPHCGSSSSSRNINGRPVKVVYIRPFFYLYGTYGRVVCM